MSLTDESLAVLQGLRNSQTKKFGYPNGPEADNFFHNELLPELVKLLKTMETKARLTQLFEHYRDTSGIKINRYCFKRFVQEELRRNARAVRVPKLFYVRDDSHLVNAIEVINEATSIQGQLLTLEMKKNKGGVLVTWPQQTECRQGMSKQPLYTIPML
jgi:predicted RNA-binding protein